MITLGIKGLFLFGYNSNDTALPYIITKNFYCVTHEACIRTPSLVVSADCSTVQQNESILHHKID